MTTKIKEPKERARQNVPKKMPSRRQAQEREFGEGNYKAARNYDRAATAFAESGRVATAARAAAPATRQEAEELKRAEREGQRRSKGEDPAVSSGTKLPKP